MNKFIYLILFFGLIFISCGSELNNLSDNDDPSGEEVKLYAQKHIEMKTKGVALEDNLWESGQIIKIKFLNGTATQQDQVKRLSVDWLDYANLSFQFVEASEQADIKIAFDWQGDGVTWSQVGIDAKYVPQSQPSLNFGKLSKVDRLAKRDILMQFGHVLGLVNEHRSEGSPIEFDVEVLYEYYMAEGWTVKEVTDFFLIPFSDTKTIREEYDSKSIMCWPIDEVVTLNGFGQARNSELSEGDKEFIAKLYPKQEDGHIVYITGSLEPNGNIVNGYYLYKHEFKFSTTSKIIVDWGDGNIQHFDNPMEKGVIQHTYLRKVGQIINNKDYSIKIYGSKDAITYFYSFRQNILDLDITNCKQLEEISCSDHDVFTKLDLSHNNKLTIVDIFGNTQLKEISFPYSSTLKLLKLGACNSIDSLDLSKSFNIETISVTDRILSLNLSNNVTFTNLNLSNKFRLMHLDLSNSKVETLSLTTNPTLEYLDLTNTPLINNDDLFRNLVNILVKDDRTKILKANYKGTLPTDIAEMLSSKNWTLIR